MSKITSIATGVPKHKHLQSDLFLFADKIYNKTEADSRKLRFLYNQSGIDSRYSAIADFTSVDGKELFPDVENDVPDVGKRMEIYNKYAAILSADTVKKCIEGKINKEEITHLITVSCTGMSAPGLDLQVMELMNLPKHIVRTSVNFMGCYAAIHAMKIADAFCNSSENANVIIVCTEFCTLHFQKEATIDNLTASLLFADGCAAMLMQPDKAGKGLRIENFFSDVTFEGKKDMAWEISSKGFLMTLSGYVPELIKTDFEKLVSKALGETNRAQKDISHWCIHPGGKKILEAISESMGVEKEDLQHSYDVLREYGNMSSPTVLFVLQRIIDEIKNNNTEEPATVFGAAFGPGLTMETFTAVYG